MLKTTYTHPANPMREQRITGKATKSAAKVVGPPRVIGQVVATLGVDGKVYPTAAASAQNAVSAKYTPLPSGNLTVPDLGKQLLQLAREGDTQGVHNSLSRGAPFTSDWLGMSALHFAAANNHFGICELLIKAGINKNAKTKVDRTALHLAVYNGHERIVELLLSKGCQVNPRDMLRMTPLHWAVQKKHKDIVSMLLKYNAEVDVVSKFNRTPLGLAVLTEQAGILEELETYRKAERKRKLTAEREKETSQAVSSIIESNSSDVSNTKATLDKVNKMDTTDSDEEGDTQNSQQPIKTEAIENDTATLDDNTVNMLKSHGISMMQDEVSTSQDLLTTALKNGRQLVISEGGKWVLNEARNKIVTSTAPKTLHISNTTNNNIKNQKNNNIIPVRLKTNSVIAPATATTSAAMNNIHKVPVTTPLNKVRSNAIVKAKDAQNTPTSIKNKNIRIISLDDFKKMYTSSVNMKTGQMNISSPRLVKLLAEKQATGQLKVNNSSPRTTNGQAQKVAQVKPNEGDAMTNIIEVVPNGTQANPAKESSPFRNPLAKPSITPLPRLPLNRIDSASGRVVKLCTLPKTSATVVASQPNKVAITSQPNKVAIASQPNKVAIASQPNKVPIASQPNKVGITPQSTKVTIAAQAHKLAIALQANKVAAASQPNKVAIASVKHVPVHAPVPVAMSITSINAKDIYRQLSDLRRLNEQLRRKVETLTQENVDMRQRLDRVESMLLVERNEDYVT